MALDAILGTVQPRSIEDVVAVMTGIDAALPDDDGVKWFNRLYLRVTASVRTAVASTTFHDPAFLAELDVVFADLYFSALRAAERGDVSQAPAAWQPLLQSRRAPGIARIQFALAGMNAHINRDLPEGIVRSFQTLGGSPLTDHRRRADFDSVNAILERVERDVRGEFSVGLVGALDHLGGDLDNVVAMWKVKAARAAAWTNAQVLWTLRDLPDLRDRFMERLDGLTGLAGRGLLRPVV